eukprot:scaffold19680_cov100-Isochrysis_galbana.AAC.2
MDFEDEFRPSGAPAAFAFEMQDDDDEALPSQPFNFIEDAEEDDSYAHGLGGFGGSGAGTNGLECGSCDEAEATAAGLEAGERAPLSFVEDDEREPVRLGRTT